MRIMVITPTTGKSVAEKAILSVQDQTIGVEHLVVYDGEEAYDNGKFGGVTELILPENVGRNNWYGHRVYAAMPLLVNADFILFLDQDNWFEPNHVETMVNHIKDNDLMWAYSLRRICNERGEYLRDDDCESLGKWPTFYNQSLNFVDTNCYCFRRDYLVHIAHAFYGQWGADRQFYDAASKYLPTFGCTGKATVNYRAPERLHQMFKEGNEHMMQKYSGKLPWRENE